MKDLYNKGTELKITGIVKVKNENTSNGYLGYTEELTKYIMEQANKTEIVKQQLNNPTINVFTGLPFDEILQESYEANLKTLGAGSEENPYIINIYPKEANSKKEIKEFINIYNNSASEEDKIIYSDQMEELTCWYDVIECNNNS